MKILILCLACVLFQAAATKLSAEELWEQQMQKLDELLAEQKETEENAKTTHRMIGLPHFGIDFEEDPDSITVHTLRPENIDIVGAMGDSITAAFGAGADSVSGLGIEYRGISYSVGGDAELEQALTLPNILKKFNPKVDGYSYGNGPLVNKYPYGFNVAVGGHRAYHMLGQAEHLIDLLKTDNRTIYEHDWKVVTLFIGGNDLCAIGRDPDGTTPEVYVQGIKDGLDLLHAEVPRMLVNIVDILEVYLLPQVGNGYGSTAQCRALQQTFCGYVIDTADDEVEQARLIDINKQYQVQLQELIDSGIYDTRDDFTVVIQPFLRDSVLPYTEDGQVDATYFAPDCFHFSDIGHAMAALNLWNNMLEPVGQKSTVWNITEIKVPTKEHPYIFTSKNSAPAVRPTTRAPATDPVTEDPETEVPVWSIVVMAVLAALLIVQLFALVYVCRSSKKTESLDAEVMFENKLNSDAKTEKF